MTALAYASLGLYALACGVFILYLFWPRRPLAWAARGIFLACLAGHLGFVIALGLQTRALPLTTPAQFINMTILAASLLMLPLILRKTTLVMGAFYLPVATLVLNTALHIDLSPAVALTGASRWLYPLHTVMVTLGEALFVVAALTSIIYLLHERIIRRGSIHGPATALPPLRILDHILYACLCLGFAAISAGMVLGGFWASHIELLGGTLAPRIAAGAIIWFIFALSLHQRFAIGWKGRRTAVITLVGCVVMVLLAIAIRLVFPGTHGLGLLQ